jgi:hypothetical protein
MVYQNGSSTTSRVVHRVKAKNNGLTSEVEPYQTSLIIKYSKSQLVYVMVDLSKLAALALPPVHISVPRAFDFYFNCYTEIVFGMSTLARSLVGAQCSSRHLGHFGTTVDY